MILLLDHDDSFVHTLASYVVEAGGDAVVRRVSTLSLADVIAMKATHIILSPGPGTPRECPLAIEVIHLLGSTTPILGVCLGHQCIAAAFGARVVRSAHPRHGMTSSVTHDGKGLFTRLPSPLHPTRYHSLTVAKQTLPPELILTAVADDGEVMGIRHRTWPVEGVQFHPESVLTEWGHQLIGTFIARSV